MRQGHCSRGMVGTRDRCTDQHEYAVARVVLHGRVGVGCGLPDRVVVLRKQFDHGMRRHRFGVRREAAQVAVDGRELEGLGLGDALDAAGADDLDHFRGEETREEHTTSTVDGHVAEHAGEG